MPDQSSTPDKIFDAEFTEAAPAVEAYADFVAIVRQLRRDCPWDREQTHESVKHLLIEEAYETVEAIDNEDWPELSKELGDLLLHVVFHSVMAEQDGRFTMKDVIDAETTKLVVRHPHVFGDTQVDGVGDVLTNWEQIKMKEKGRKSALDGVPAQLPGLLAAHRIQEKAAGVGFDFPEAAGAWEKVTEEIGEFGELTDTGASDERLEDELGDVLFALVNYARFKGLNAENALRRTNDKFRSRFQHIESRLQEKGRTPKDASLEEMDVFWDEAKAAEKAD
jgi:XTP/dITP diphosphohydrolase/tetrapyrrole methylase family protein/MazG family protein